MDTTLDRVVAYDTGKTPKKSNHAQQKSSFHSRTFFLPGNVPLILCKSTVRLLSLVKK